VIEVSVTAPDVPTVSQFQPDSRWEDHPERGCRGGSPNIWFPIEVDPKTGEESEPPYPPPEAKRICNVCPVRAECLEFALDTDQSAGIWGGLTTYQRRLTKIPKERKRCPTCGGIDVVPDRQHQICLACGISWEIW
jgi:WhiB family redox-sensing transcriptional regulator